MGSVRSEAPQRLAIPAPLSPVVVVIGWVALQFGGLLVPLLGLRPGLVASEVLLAVPALLALTLFGIPLVQGLGLRAVSGRVFVVSLVLGGSFWCASLGLFELQYLVWKPPAAYLEAFKRLHDALRPSGPLDALASLVAIAVAPAVCEELLFRGVVLSSLLASLGASPGILGSAGLFALIHADPLSLYRIPFSFAVGMGLALLRMRSGSLVPPILVHATLNSITLVAAATADLTEDHQPLLGAALFLAGVGASAGLFRLARSGSSAR